MNDSSCPNQLDWQAFCYAAGELSRAEAEQFESLLAADQPAREALARAVELTQVVAAAEARSGDLVTPARRITPASHSERTWQTWWSGVLIGGVASLLAAFLVWGVVAPGVKLATRGNPQAKYALAAAWTQARAETATMWHADAPLFAETDDDNFSNSLLLDEPVAGKTPSWLTAAVNGGTPDADADSAGEGTFEE